MIAELVRWKMSCSAWSVTASFTSSSLTSRSSSTSFLRNFPLVRREATLRSDFSACPSSAFDTLPSWLRSQKSKMVWSLAPASFCVSAVMPRLHSSQSICLFLSVSNTSKSVATTSVSEMPRLVITLVKSSSESVTCSVLASPFWRPRAERKTSSSLLRSSLPSFDCCTRPRNESSTCDEMTPSKPAQELPGLKASLHLLSFEPIIATAPPDMTSSPATLPPHSTNPSASSLLPLLW
mmetsp:Transcript_16356/g.39222  ORF Transcript_16356/g.39222 Transcript_16356/m.39222 type:complete len:237 (+) Transcript_16356:192-902(+)